MNLASKSSARSLVALTALLVIATLTWLWQKTQSLNPQDHGRFDASLRELRSLDRTINQDVLRARYQLINSYDPVLHSYRRVGELEAIIATPLRFLDDDANRRLADAVTRYRAMVTAKQWLIEKFKYRTAELRELLGHLPDAGTGVARAASQSGDALLAAQVNEIVRLTLVYNLTSDETYARVILKQSDLLDGEPARAAAVKRRIGTLMLDIHRLLRVKPAADGLLRQIFDQPVIEQEESVAGVYYMSYEAAENAARRYRVILYAVCIALFGVLALGVRRLQHGARELAVANTLLEERVAARTRALDVRNREMRVVLDNVDQALFTSDLDGRLSRERSTALDRWFPNAAPGALLWDALKDADPEGAAWLQVGWEQLGAGDLPLEVALDQLPRKLSAAGRHYQIGYRRLAGDEHRAVRILVVISDVSELVARERREADQQEHLVIFQQLLRDPAEYEEFFRESRRLIEAVLARGSGSRADLLRALHTLKGNCGMYGVSSIATLCHQLEAELAERQTDLHAEELSRLEAAWTSFAEKVQALMSVTAEDPVGAPPVELQELRQAITAGRDAPHLLRLLREAERQPVERRLARIAEQARRLGRRLGKGDVQVTTEANGVRLDAKRWAPFWGAFVHMLRNALDHGIEAPEERRAAGKPLPGQLGVRTLRTPGWITIEISDDGRGIDWKALRAAAVARGLTAGTQDDLLAVLLRGGLSTKSVATEHSGRGAGLSACHLAARALGGRTTVLSEPGRGTTFRFAIPDDDSVPDSLTSAA